MLLAGADRAAPRHVGVWGGEESGGRIAGAGVPGRPRTGPGDCSEEREASARPPLGGCTEAVAHGLRIAAHAMEGAEQTVDAHGDPVRVGFESAGGVPGEARSGV